MQRAAAKRASLGARRVGQIGIESEQQRWNLASANRSRYNGCPSPAATVPTVMAKPGRNDPCPCGSNSSAPASSTRPRRPARDLLVRFPDVHDGWDRLGMVHEVRGDNRQAADCYRKVIEFIRQHPDNYDAAIVEQFAKLVERLDPPAAT